MEDSRLNVSVVVLTRNRSVLLERCLQSIQRQTPGPEEIIVVDNGSSDDTSEVVHKICPDAHFISNSENLGIRGRNIGYEAVNSEFVLSLDDDIELLDPQTLLKIEKRLSAQPTAGALTLKLLEQSSGTEFPRHHWWHPRDRALFTDVEFETDSINEAAVAFRTQALEQAGYYYEKMFWGAEDWDLVLSLLDLGFVIFYFPIPVMHLAPRGSLNSQSSERHILLVRNRCWTALRRLSFPRALWYILPRLILWLFRSIRYGYFRQYRAGILELIQAVPSILADRKPISRATRLKIRRVHRQMS